MNARRVLLACIVTFTSSATIRTAHAQEPVASSEQFAMLMRLKLDKSQSILEGLTLEDYEKIGSSAKRLKLLSTESGWNVIQTEEYAMQSNEFRRAADAVVRAAEAKDISKATLGYVTLTMKCVECHSYMRSHRVQSTTAPSQ